MVKNNSLPPASQPWVRELEKRIKNLERETSATHSRVSHLKNVTSSPKMNLDSLTVGELKVGGDPVVIPFLTGAGIMGWSVSGGTVVGNRISSTGGPITLSATMPDLNIEGGFVMEWALEASATVDSIRVTNSIDPPAVDAEPNDAMAEEVSTYYASAGYNLGDIEDYVPEPGEDVRPPVPVMVSFTFTNPETGPFTVEIVSSKASYTLPGQGGIQVTAEGDVLIVDSDGDSHPLRELTEAEAQAIIETAENLEQAQRDLEDARTEAQQNFGVLDDKLGQAFPDNIFDVGASIDAAMNMANGKNAVSYTTYGNTTKPPGTAPGKSLGEGRRIHDMHRNRLSNGTIIGEWIWTGSTWTQLELSDAMLSSLDVGKLTAGTADIETAVINQLWGQLGVFDKLDVRTDAYVSGINLKDGAVTARTLNVVPETGSGGMELKPPGVRIIPDDTEGGTAVSLRVDEENLLSFAKGGDTTFSVNGDGNMVVQELDVNSSLRYKDVELQDIIDSLPKGIVTIARANANASAGTNQARIVASTFRTPATHRMYRISFTARVTSVPPKRGILYLRQSTGNSVNALNSSKQTWYLATENNEHVTFTGVYGTDSDLGWPLNETITIGVFAASEVSGETIQFHSNGPPELVVEDLGPQVDVESHTPYVPSTGGGSGGGGTEEQPAPREYVQTFSPSWHQSYLSTGGQNLNGANRMYHGQPGSGGVLKSMIGFSTAVQTFIGSGTVTKVEVYLKNTHTWFPSGMTAAIGWHSSGSKVSTYAQTWTHASTYGTRTSFNRGQGRWVTMPLGVRNALTGSSPLRGITLDPTTYKTTSYYGHFDGPATRLRITVRK